MQQIIEFLVCCYFSALGEQLALVYNITQQYDITNLVIIVNFMAMIPKCKQITRFYKWLNQTKSYGLLTSWNSRINE